MIDIEFDNALMFFLEYLKGKMGRFVFWRTSIMINALFNFAQLVVLSHATNHRKKPNLFETK